MKFILSLLPFLLSPVFLQAQPAVEVAPPNYIRTVIFTGSIENSGTPILKLGEALHLEFDDIIGDEANYYYTLEHFNYDWTPSVLAESEYLEGIDDVRISDYQNSYNTLLLYTHYRLQIPNQDTKGFKVSGNYMLKIFNESRELVFSRKFMVYNPLTTVGVSVKRARDLQYINEKQAVHFLVDSKDLILKNPEDNVKAVILQNYNLKTGIFNIPPQYTMGNQLVYKYDQETSFWGGNEYHGYDSKDLRAATIRVQRIELEDLYHHYLYPDGMRAYDPYTYNPDINGNFVIRTMQGTNSAIEAEYVWAHFALETYTTLEGGELHLYGNFNNYHLDQSTKLTYNPESGLYEMARLFKQGYYNYKYVLRKENGELVEGFSSGNFDKTENEYAVLIYYRPVGGRFDQIIGFGSASSLDITN